jgi:hypothetical protein
MMEVDTLAKHRIGKYFKSTLPEPKERTYSVFVFCEDAVWFENMKLRASPPETADAYSLRQAIEQKYGIN